MAYSDNQAGQISERFLNRPIYRAVSATTDTLVTADNDGIINYSGASGAVTVPVATTFVVPVGSVITIVNSGAGTVTLTRSSTDTINGGASGTVATGTAKRLMKVSESAGVSTFLLY